MRSGNCLIVLAVAGRWVAADGVPLPGRGAVWVVGLPTVVLQPANTCFRHCMREILSSRLGSSAVQAVQRGPKPKQSSGNLDVQLARQASAAQLPAAGKELPSIAKLLQEAGDVVVVDEAHVIKSEVVRFLSYFLLASQH